MGLVKVINEIYVEGVPGIKKVRQGVASVVVQLWAT